MAEVTRRTANWRLFGGGGLLVGGLLVLVGAILPDGAATAALWLSVIGWLLIGIGLLVVALGQTGGNGAVGGSSWGKAVLVIAGLAAIALALFSALGGLAVEIPAVLAQIALIVLAAALILGAVAVYGGGVARGLARLALFVVAIVAVLLVINTFATIDTIGWLTIVFGVVTLLTGLLYLLNRNDVKV